ncbi:Molybdopterin oxidoreductase, iron-sulfur binding subunit [hydrothermal vent metagenome]|uniref:Molybdopterin oxidoreductase, iron-sulfur binding subunit n=1 Tax=hydrothermal vent metagenome TaxID=652676 RepID=A0A3B1C3R3_9ZZZZ
MSKENKKYWKSIDEYNKKELSVSKSDEFMEGTTDEFDLSKLNGLSRRKFLALLSASTAFAVTACSDYHDQKELAPYTKRPDGLLPGKPNYYASTCNDCSQACGILIKTREGRPIKVDGNDLHPINKGKICATGQASVYNLYDPSRLQFPTKGKNKVDWTSADSDIINKLDETVKSGKKIAVITHPINSPTEKKLLDEFKQRYATAEVYSYELFNNCNKKFAWFKSYGSPEIPSIKWDEADIILSLESDFLAKEANHIEATRLFSSRRDIMKSDHFNRLYVAEAGMSLTNTNSDYRIQVRPDAQYDFVLSLMSEVVKKGASVINIDSSIKKKLSNYSLDSFVTKWNIDAIKVNYLIDDLINNKGKAIVYAGEVLPADVHIAVNLLNEILGNTKLYDYDRAYVNTGQQTHLDDFKVLIDSFNKGEFGAVIHYDVNPVFHLPSSMKYADALKNIDLVVSLVHSKNESTVNDTYTLPINHSFESWGDAQARKNVYSLRQPVIAPLYNTRQREAVILTWITSSSEAYSEDMYHKYLMESCRENIYNEMKLAVDFKTFWLAALHDGYVELNKQSTKKHVFDLTAFDLRKHSSASTDFGLLLSRNYFIGDGRFANNGWLQEIPNPISKVAWDNYAAISPSTAKKMDLEIGDIVKVSVGENSVDLPVMIQPGIVNDMITVELGYGRTVIGDAGKDAGFNASDLLNQQNGSSPWITSGISIEKTGKSYELVSTQEHHSLDDDFVKDFHLKRGIIREATLAEYKTNPEFAHEYDEELVSITIEHEFNEIKWGMAIDMNKCVSCATCVASCDVENNVQVVGKDQVAIGREMHWIRIDRYYSGTPEDPIVSNQPMLCQHCDNAPCENVCPVNATNHSPDGLNQMIYNRCVGTRYCANNCPYKVRRFNFFNFLDHFADSYYENEVTPLVYNPEVTIRSRGVMEKCSFCVQKISEERENAIREGREVNGKNVVTACQQACPADAIVFGDVNDPNSKVAQYRNHKLGYSVLQNLNVKPNVTYVAKLRNTHSEDA